MFESDMYTFLSLASYLSWRFPTGIAVMRLDNMDCTVYTPGDIPQNAFIGSCISWLRVTRGKSIGIALKKTSDAIDVSIVDVQYEARYDEEAVKVSIAQLVAAMLSVSHDRCTRRTSKASN